jgi:hypothetical protein
MLLLANFATNVKRKTSLKLIMIPQVQLLKHLIVHHHRHHHTRQYSFYVIHIIGVRLMLIRLEYPQKTNALNVMQTMMN